MISLTPASLASFSDDAMLEPLSAAVTPMLGSLVATLPSAVLAALLVIVDVVVALGFGGFVLLGFARLVVTVAVLGLTARALRRTRVNAACSDSQSAR